MNNEITKTTSELGKFLSKPFDSRLPEEVLSNLTEANLLLGRIAWAVAESDKILAKHIADATRKYTDQNVTFAKNFISADVADTAYYADLCKLQEKQLHYRIESLRTMVSYLKSEMTNL